jgi:hypothetical protein
MAVSQMPRVLNLWRDVPNFTHDWNYKRDGLPPGAVYIGRTYGLYGLPESKWHNPYKARRHTREEHQRVVDEFERYLHESGLIAEVRELRGLNLVCWCVPLPCHGDVLLRLANAGLG